MVEELGSSLVEASDVFRMAGLVERGATTEAIAHVRSLLDRGVTVDDLIVNLLVEVQAHAGSCWERDVWSVAQEHAATGVVDSVLSMLSVTAETTGWRGRLAVVCVEEEWHSLPAKLLAERLRLRGWSVVFLGHSMPGPHLERYLAGEDFDGVVLSCQVAMNLIGASRSIAACHRAGHPAVIGGRGLGPDSLRATNLGADAWCASVDELSDLMDLWVSSKPSALVAPALDHAEHVLLLADASDLVRRALARVGASSPVIDRYDDAQLLHARQDIDYLVRFLAASVIAGDDRILRDLLPWMDLVLVSRGVDPALVELGLESLQSSLGEGFPRSCEVLERVLAER